MGNKNKNLNKLHQQFIKCRSFVNPELIKNKKYCENGDLIIVKTSENIEQAGKAATYFGQKCILGSDILLIRHNQNPKYLSYVLSSKFCRKQIETFIPKTSVIMHFNITHLNKIKIPLPSLEKQYEYYKEEILKY